MTKGSESRAALSDSHFQQHVAGGVWHVPSDDPSVAWLEATIARLLLAIHEFRGVALHVLSLVTNRFDNLFQSIVFEAGRYWRLVIDGRLGGRRFRERDDFRNVAGYGRIIAIQDDGDFSHLGLVDVV